MPTTDVLPVYGEVLSGAGVRVGSAATCLRVKDDDGSYCEALNVPLGDVGRIAVDFEASPYFDLTDPTLSAEYVVRLKSSEGTGRWLARAQYMSPIDDSVDVPGGYVDRVIPIEGVTSDFWVALRSGGLTLPTFDHTFIQNWATPSILRVTYAAIRLTADTVVVEPPTDAAVAGWLVGSLGFGVREGGA